MLSWSLVLQRIKDELSLPFQPLEKSDTELIDYCKRTCVRKFSTFFPTKNRITLDTEDGDTHVPNKSSEFYIIDPDGREILNVCQLHFNLGQYIVLGHNPIGAFSYEGIPELALQNFKANNTLPFSTYEHTYEFMAPNKLRISPRFSGQCTVEYDRIVDYELSDINPELEDYFIELCLGSVFMMIGRIRKKYQNIQSPYGDITLDADSLFNEGQERLNKVIDEMKTGSQTNIIFDRG